MALVGVALVGALLLGGCGSGASNIDASTSSGSGGASSTGGSTSSSTTTSSSSSSTSSSSGGDGTCDSNADCPTDGQWYCMRETDPCGTCGWQVWQCDENVACSGDAYCNVACHACVGFCKTDAECSPQDACDPTSHKCVPKPCQEDAACPKNFACTQGACARKACSADSECQGFCAGGQCVSYRGYCFECV